MFSLLERINCNHRGDIVKNFLKLIRAMKNAVVYSWNVEKSKVKHDYKLGLVRTTHSFAGVPVLINENFIRLVRNDYIQPSSTLIGVCGDTLESLQIQSSQLAIDSPFADVMLHHELGHVLGKHHARMPSGEHASVYLNLEFECEADAHCLNYFKKEKVIQWLSWAKDVVLFVVPDDNTGVVMLEQRIAAIEAAEEPMEKLTPFELIKIE